ncbi:flagellar brake protein [Pandoraea terrae]|uniref:Flagellar brake protein n=1 Tax=Pandoraea terrae TaxID=1537710 RepID=A0A5E4RXD6_9BURK|nr:flagellar brake protein [Pandoraea terrae]VVD66498.1 flagellar brake protein [Pandoraea terrae]
MHGDERAITVLMQALPLIPLTPADVPVNAALPWPICDANGDTLLQAQEHVPDADALAWLFTTFSPHRPLSLSADADTPETTLRDASAESPAPDAANDIDPAAPARTNGAAGEPAYGLADLNLRPGDWLQIQLPPGAGSQRVRTRVIGYAPNQMLFLTAPTGRAAPMTLQPSERLELWTFSGEDIFHFVCTVERVERTPFPYVLLSPPAQIRRKVLRRSQRAPARLVATVTGASLPGARLGLLQDVSAEGVSLLSPSQIGSPGDTLELAFRVRVGDIDVPLAAEGTIRSLQTLDDGGHLHGIELPALEPAHYVALKCYVYEKLLALGNA